MINEKQGGILGHKIVVKSINDNGNPQTGTSELIKYLSSNPKPNNFYPGAESTLEGALMISRLDRNDDALLRIREHLNRYLDEDVALAPVTSALE